MPAAEDAAGAALLGINGGGGGSPLVPLTIDTPRAVLIDTINHLIRDNARREVPLGSLYFNATTGEDPRKLLGYGDWERYAKGRQMISLNEATAAIDTPGETGNIVATAGAATVGQYIAVYVWRRIG